MWVEVTSFLHHKILKDVSKKKKKILKDLTIRKITLNIYHFPPHLQNK